MLELAQVMVDLGAERAINLDGGGSPTFVARQRYGSWCVRNRPSDGRERALVFGGRDVARRRSSGDGSAPANAGHRTV